MLETIHTASSAYTLLRRYAGGMERSVFRHGSFLRVDSFTNTIEGWDPCHGQVTPGDMLTWEPGRGAHPSRKPQGNIAAILYNPSNTSASATPRWEGRKEGGGASLM